MDCSKKPNSQGNRQCRMYIDYGKLNAVTIPDRYPMSEVEEVLANLGGNKYLSVLDLKSGFHQIPLKESDMKKQHFL